MKDKKGKKIIIVDDEPSIVRLLERILAEDGYDIKTSDDPINVLEMLNDFNPNIIISDIRMPNMTGIELMKEIKTKKPEIDFILLTAYASVENAVTAMKEGAIDYITKPLKNLDEIRLSVEKALELQNLKTTQTFMKRQISDGLPSEEIIFAGMEHIKNAVNEVAGLNVTVLILGESGTGKSLIAKYIHFLSGKTGPFVELNCAAIPETLIESELFGHEKGSFTGALKTKQGKFELAQNGTIFLDEIAELPLDLQSKLLRVLQDGSYERVGGSSTFTSNARVIAATNQDLKMAIMDKKFRKDLYYRLDVFPIHLPPLRERGKAVLTLLDHFNKIIPAKIGKKPIKISEETMDQLIHYSWPGNIRELYNIIERAVILQSQPQVICESVFEKKAEYPLINQDLNIQDIEKNTILNALSRTGGHRKKAADLLGMSLRTLYNKIKEYNIK